MHSSENTPQDPASRVTRSLRKRINSVDTELTTTPKKTPLRSLNKITEKDTKPMTNSPALRIMKNSIADTVNLTPALNSPARRITRRISLSEGIDIAPQPSPIRRSRRLSVNSEEHPTPSKSTIVRATRGNVALIEQSVPEEEEVDKNSPDRRVTRSSSKSPQVEMMNEKRSTRTASKSPSSFENAADKRKFSNSPIESVLEKRVTRSLSKSPSLTQMISRSDSPKTVANNSSNKINMSQSGSESPIPFKSPQTVVRRASPNVTLNRNSPNSSSQSPKSQDSDNLVKALSLFQKAIIEKSEQLVETKKHVEERESTIEATNDNLNTTTDVESKTDSIQSKEKSPKKTDLVLPEQTQSKATSEATDDHLNNSKDESITNPSEIEVKSPDKTAEESEKQNSADPVVLEEIQSKASSEATNDNLDSSTYSKSITEPSENEVKSKKTGEKSDEQNSVVSEEIQSKAASAEIESVKSLANSSENNANQLQFAKSWSQPVVKKLTDVVTFIDGFTTKEAERKEKMAQEEEKLFVQKTKNQSRARESDDESSYEDSEADDDDARNEFIDSEAMEASGDSMDSSERAYIEENEISVKGESLGSDDTDELDQDEESDAMTSFIVTDEEEEEEKLSDADSLLGYENGKKKYRKIITRPVIDSSSDNEEPSVVKATPSGNDELCSENNDRQGKTTSDSENKWNENEVISLNSTTVEQRDQTEDELLSSDKKKSNEKISNKNNQSLNSSRHKIQLAGSTNDSTDDENNVSSVINLVDATQSDLLTKESFESISSTGDTSLNKTKNKSLQRKSFDKDIAGKRERRSGSSRTSLNESMKALVRKMLTQNATTNKTSDESDEDSDDRNNALLETFKRTSLKRRSSLKKTNDNKRRSESDKNVTLREHSRKEQDELLSDENTDAKETSIRKKEKSIIEELNNSQANISINDSNVKDKSMGSSATKAQKKLNKSQENKNFKKNNPSHISDDNESDNDNNSNNDTQNKLRQSFKKLNDSNREKSKDLKINKSLKKDISQELESTEEFSNNSSSYETYSENTESDTEESKKIPEETDDEQSDDNDQPIQTEQIKARKSIQGLNDSKQSIAKRTSQYGQQSNDVSEELNHSKIIKPTESDDSDNEDDNKSKSYKKIKSREQNLSSIKSKSIQKEDDEELSNDESDSNAMFSEDAESATELSSEHVQGDETSSSDGEQSDKKEEDVSSETENIIENSNKRRSVQKIEESSDSQDDIEEEINESKRSSKKRQSISKKSTDSEKKTNINKSIRESLNISKGNKSLQKDTHKTTERNRSMNNTLHLSTMFNENSTSEEYDEDEQLQDSSANSCATFNKSNSSSENDEDEDETLHLSVLLDKKLNKSKILPSSPSVSSMQKKIVDNTPDTKKPSSSTKAGASCSNKKSKASVPKNVDETQQTSTPKVVAQKSATQMTETDFHSILDRVDLFMNAASEAKRKLKLQNKAEQPKKLKKKKIQIKDDAEDESVEKVPVRNKKQKDKEIKKSLPHVVKILEKEFKTAEKIIARKQSQPEILHQKVQDKEIRTKPSRKRSKSESKATQGIAQQFESIDENISAYEANLKNKSTKSKKNKLELGDLASNSKKKLKIVESSDDRKPQIAKSTTSKKDFVTSVGFFEVSDVDHCPAALSKQKSKNKQKSTSNEYLPNDFKKKKLNILNDIPFGPFIEEPVTPESKKTINGFKESNLTPKPIGFKVRSILSAGQKEIPLLDKTKRKTKKPQIEDRKLKRVWTSVGFFDVADIDEKIPKKQYRPETHGASTEFVVKPLDVQKYGRDGISSSALDFKKKALYNDKVRRETSTELLQRNTKKLAFKKH